MAVTEARRTAGFRSAAFQPVLDHAAWLVQAVTKEKAQEGIEVMA